MRRLFRTFGHRISDVVIRAFLAAIKVLPYDQRLATAGWVASRVIAPVTGNSRRIRENLTFVMPDLSPQTREDVVREVPDNMARTMVEIYDGSAFLERVQAHPIQGPGLKAIMSAQEEGRGALLVTGHFGNYVAVLAALRGQGLPSGGLYKPMSNPFFNTHYVAAMGHFSAPMFERGRKGMTKMVRHLRDGGLVGIVQDQRINNAPVMSFMGKPARTATSAADLALKYDVPMIPCYGIRLPDGNFDIVTEAPIALGTAQEMTEALNQSLEARVRANPGQWMWTHNRWRGAGNETAADRKRAKRASR